MLSDRELLGLAAKAANYFELDGWSIQSSHGMRWVDADREFVRYWNPLVNDGDALRLAVKLGIGITYSKYVDRVYAGQTNTAPWAEDATHEQDKYAATRRAIVCAAAEIGKDML